MPHRPRHCADPRWTHGRAEARAHWSSASRLILGVRTHHGRREMERGRRRSSPIALVAEAVMKEGRRRRNMVVVLGAQCHGVLEMEGRSWGGE
jgi:hypothetical protein